MLNAAVAVLLAWNLAGAEAASNEPPQPRIDRAHGPVVKTAKRANKQRSRVTPTSMEDEQENPSTQPAPAASKELKPGDKWKPRKAAPKAQPTPVTKAAAKPATENSAQAAKPKAKTKEPESAEFVEVDAVIPTDEDATPGTLPADVESTAIESSAEPLDDDLPTTESPADESPADEEPADEEPAADTTNKEPSEDMPADEPSEDDAAKPEATDDPADDAEQPAEPAATKDETSPPVSDAPVTVAPKKRPHTAAEKEKLAPTSPATTAKPDSTKTPPLKTNPLHTNTAKKHPANPSAAKPGSPQPSGDKSQLAKPRQRQPKAALVPLDSQSILMRDRLRQTLATYYQRPVNARDNTPWEVFHWVIAYNVYAEVLADGPWGKRTNAVGWLCFNRPCHGQHLLGLEQGRIKAQYGVGLQGHEGQFLAILAQSRVMIDYPLRVGNQNFKVSDLVRSEMLGCKTGTELTFKLIALSHYLELESKWKSADGDSWDIPRLIREEISKPIQGAACGGTHRLMGLSYAVRMRRLRGEPVDGEYRRAQAYVRDYQQYAFSLQNPDGSFSTNWLAGREAKADVDRRVQTTGHILEWLVYSLEDHELRDPRVIKCVRFLTNTLLSEPNREWKIGPLGHSLRALTLYDRRVFEAYDAPSEDSPDQGAGSDLVEMDAVPATPHTAKVEEKPSVRTATKPKVLKEIPPAEPAADKPLKEAAPAESMDELEPDCSTEEDATGAGDQPQMPADLAVEDDESEAVAEEAADDEQMATHDEDSPTESTASETDETDDQQPAPEQDEPSAAPVRRAVRPSSKKK